jgi:hypothetical protein
MFDGPASTQSLVSGARGNVRETRRRSAARVACGASRIGHVTRLLNQAARFLCFVTRGSRRRRHVRTLATAGTAGRGQCASPGSGRLPSSHA